MPPSYIGVRAVVWAYSRGQTDRHTQTDRQMRVTTIHFASTTRAKCNKMLETDILVLSRWQTRTHFENHTRQSEISEQHKT